MFFACVNIDQQALLPMRKSILYLLLSAVACTATAQQRIAVEKIRCYNINQPLITYLQNKTVAAGLAAQLNQTALAYLKAPITDTTSLTVELLDYTQVPSEIRPEYTSTDTSLLHLYIDFFETDPYYFFRKYPDPDSALIKRTRTVFVLRSLILNVQKKIVGNESLHLLISEAETPAIGNKMNGGIRLLDLSVTEKTFTALFKTATGMLLNPANDLSMAELKLQPAYFYDNYLLPKTAGKPRDYVSENRNIIAFKIRNESQLIRFGQAEYEEIRIRGKNQQPYPPALLDAINAAEHARNSDFVFLNQAWRDVQRDKNYQLRMIAQVDPANIPARPELFFTNFLEGNLHQLLLEKDTLAHFYIRKEVSEPASKIFPDIIGNGMDTGMRYHSPLYISNKNTGRTVVYAYVIDGSMKGLPFRIKCSGAERNLKEFFVGDRLVCIADGKFYPRKFVLFDASLSAETLNQLFMIGFNRFLE